MKYVLIVGLALVATAAAGQRTMDDVGRPPPWFSTAISSYYELVVTDGQGQALFRSGYGSCLRGPLVFLDSQGNEQFWLAANVDLPAGCSRESQK